ncbi:MAG: nucleoside-diphosphate kinase [Candidatus Buchananbacteria bacterium]|jgi:nucleoside diphosphate kinase
MIREYPPGQEIKDLMPKKEIAFAFIKPEYIDDLPAIESILKENGLMIVYEDKVKLSPQAVDYIYADSINQHFYPAMRKYLSSHEVIVLLVGGDGLEAQRVLSSLKKKETGDGVIRQKLQRDSKVSDEDLKLWQNGAHPRQDELSVVLTQKNVIHTADSADEALSDLRMILGDKFDRLKKKGNLPTELWEIFNEN